MIELSPRKRESTLTSVEVMSIEASGICQPLHSDNGPTIPALERMLEKRLEIARTGIHEAQQLLHDGNEEDARIVLEKVDEDLHLLRRRVRREFEQVGAMTCGV